MRQKINKKQSAMPKGRFKVEWYGNQILREISAISENEEKQSAERVMKRALRYVPVGKTVRAIPFRGKSYQSRYPGRLKSTIRIEKSKFKDGGYLVWMGSDLAYYSRFIEYGTIFMKKRKGYKVLKRASNLEKSYFIRRFRKMLGV